MPVPPGLWNGVLRRLRGEVPAFAVDAWLEPLTAVETPHALRIECPSAFHRERIRTRFLSRIKEFAQEEAGRAVRVELDVASTPAAPPSKKARTPATPPPAKEEPQPGLPRTFESFVVGPCNALAREASLAIARQRQPGVSPLYLYSDTGLGKSHLAHAVVTEARRSGNDRVVYASAEAFTTDLVACIRTQRTAHFKRRFRKECDLLIIEDVQFLRGKKATQLELFHTLEHLRIAGSRVVLTGDRLPRDIPDLDGRLSSHMSSGLVAEMEAPDALLRREILRVKASRGGVGLPDDCLERLVEGVRGSVRDLEGVLIQLVASASLLKRRIDLELTELALHKVTPRRPERALLEPATVVEVVAAFFRTTPEALRSRSRRQTVLRPRQLAMYLCRRYTNASLEQIGRALGREHPSVSNAIQGIERAMLEKAPLRYQVEALAAHLDRLAGRGR